MSTYFFLSYSRVPSQGEIMKVESSLDKGTGSQSSTRSHFLSSRISRMAIQIPLIRRLPCTKTSLLLLLLTRRAIFPHNINIIQTWKITSTMRLTCYLWCNANLLSWTHPCCPSSFRYQGVCCPFAESH